RIYRSDALCNYYLGKTAYLRGDYKPAKAYFSKARDLDGLRFRAPEQMNEVISRLCAKYPYSHLVDTRAAFESSSNNGIIGDELMLEHIHPNLHGYALMSDVFYRSMKQYHLIDVNKENEMEFDRLLRDMPITTVDSLTGVYTIEKMKRNWPFGDATARDSFKIESREEQLAHELAFRKTKWAIAMDSLYYFYVNKEDFKKAKTVMEGMTLEYPEEATFYEKTATLYGKLNDFTNAAFYFKKSFALSPSFQGARTLFVIYLKLDKPVEAIPYLDYAIHNNEANMNLVPVKRFSEEVIRLEKMVNRDSSDLVILNQIAEKYFAMGNKEGASKYIEKVLKTDPGNKEALMLLEHIKGG
ncbi:MAG TPA: hypothetical protein VFC34_14405, partial [Puia sp.]|nr:hypothetical protein [Puia sp.]